MATALCDCTTVSGASVPCVHLLLVIGERLVGQVKRALLHGHVFIGVDQVPVNVLDLRNRGDQLVAKGDFRNQLVIAGNAQIAQVGIVAKALQQMLPHLKVKTRRQRGIDGVVERALPQARVVEADGHQRARRKSLGVVEVCRRGVRI